jgi:outer membrane protein insertion porin family
VIVRLLALALLGGVPSVAVAQDLTLAPAEGIVGEVIVRGTRWIEEAAVLARIGLRAGEPITREKIRRDLEAVYATGFFEDVRVLLEPQQDGTLRVVFAVVEKPAVTDVRIEGNKKIDDEDLNELIDVKSFGVLNEAKIRQTVETLRDKYVEKGFYLVEIEPQVKPVGEHRVEITFQITENRKVLVSRVEFTGNEHVPDRKIKKYMQTKEAGPLAFLGKGGTFDKDVLDADQQTVQLVFLEEGYVDAEVDPPQVYLTPDKRFIHVSFHVTEGEQYEIGDIDVAGDFVPEEGLTKEIALEIVGGRPVYDVEEEQWRKATGRRYLRRPLRGKGPTIETGDTYKQSTIAQVAQAVSQLWQDRGYAFVNVTPQPMPDPETRKVNLRFRVERGEKQRIGRIRISGNEQTFDKVIRRELVFNEGELYRGSLLDASKMQLMRLGFFENVQITTPKGEGPDTLDVDVHVTEQPTGSFSVGVGFGTAQGFAVNASIQRNNFLGLGFLVNAQVDWSQRQRTINLLFSDPYFLDSRFTATLSGFWIETRYQVPEYRRGASFAFGRYLDRRNDVQVQLKYSLVDVGLRSIDASRARLYGGELFRNGLTSTIGLSLIADKRNNRIFPTKGVYFTAAASLSGGFRTSPDKVFSLLGGDFNYAEINANFRFYQPLIPKSDWLIFRFNSTLGMLFSTDGNIIPYTARYGAGGMNSVRGFPMFSLGPTVRTTVSDDPTRGDQEVLIRGTQMWINNFEIESPIVKQAGVSAVVFFDAGNAFGDAYGHGGINPLKLRTSAGFGIRWRSPIGPLRFELGFPLSPREDERKSLFDFSIGSFF